MDNHKIKHTPITPENIEEMLKEESASRPPEGGKCDLCLQQFERDQMLEYFKVDFPEPIMLTLFGEVGYSRYGYKFCLRCYNIIDIFMCECGSF